MKGESCWRLISGGPPLKQLRYTLLFNFFLGPRLEEFRMINLSKGLN